MPTKRFTGEAAVSLTGVSAGTIASSSGSASVTPAPRRNVRRGMCFFAMNMSVLHRPGTHLELRALHDAEHDRRKPVVVRGRVTHDRAQRGHVDVFDAAPDCERHHLLGEHP